MLGQCIPTLPGSPAACPREVLRTPGWFIGSGKLLSDPSVGEQLVQTSSGNIFSVGSERCVYPDSTDHRYPFNASSEPLTSSFLEKLKVDDDNDN